METAVTPDALEAEGRGDEGALDKTPPSSPSLPGNTKRDPETRHQAKCVLTGEPRFQLPSEHHPEAPRLLLAVAAEPALAEEATSLRE